jgi:hypothetical protein
MICFVCAGLTGYVFAPDGGSSVMASVTVHRTWAPALAMLGYALAFPALRLAIAESRPRTSEQASGLRPQASDLRSQASGFRAASAMDDGGASPVRSRVPDSIPLEPVPIAVAHHDPFAPPPDGFAALHPALRFASKRLTIGAAGLDTEQEDGTSHHVAWSALVGAVARRLPAAAPYAGETFVDIISTAGATLRFTPWTATFGDALAREGEERARAFVHLIAARCPAAKLDTATRTFVGGHEPALQLPDADVLAQHDARIG